MREHLLLLRAEQEQRELERYRLSDEEILGAVKLLASQQIAPSSLQAGEDDGLDPRHLATLVREIKARFGVSITLSLGEWPRGDYELWREAGADRYLLKIESSDKELYESLHAHRSYENRLRCLEDLRSLGYQVGCGCMVGIRGQTLRHLAQDIQFFARNDFDMIGIGPFIPHPRTPLRGEQKGGVAMTLKAVALTRIVTRNSHLPATTALGSMEQDFRIQGLKAGANVLMPNFTPVRAKKLYEIYPGKRCINEPTGACAFCMEGLAASIDRHIDYSTGDSLKRPRALAPAARQAPPGRGACRHSLTFPPPAPMLEGNNAEQGGIMKRIVGVLALILFAACGAAFSADKASIVYIEGDVTMNGSPAAVGDDVQPGAVLTTARDSVCQVVFNTKNIVHMAAGTTLRFDEKVLSRGATLQKGAVAMVLRNLIFIAATRATRCASRSRPRRRLPGSAGRASSSPWKTTTTPTSAPATA